MRRPTGLYTIAGTEHLPGVVWTVTLRINGYEFAVTDNSLRTVSISGDGGFSRALESRAAFKIRAEIGEFILPLEYLSLDVKSDGWTPIDVV